AVQFLPELAFGVECAGGLWVVAEREADGRPARGDLRRAGVLGEQLRQRFHLKDVEPSALVVGVEHTLAQSGDECPVLVTIGAFHRGDSVRARAQTEYVSRPGR